MNALKYPSQYKYNNVCMTCSLNHATTTTIMIIKVPQPP